MFWMETARRQDTIFLLRCEARDAGPFSSCAFLLTARYRHKQQSASVAREPFKGVGLFVLKFSKIYTNVRIGSHSVFI